MAQRPRGSVARVLVGVLAGLGPAFVQGLEVAVVDQRLAANGEERRRRAPILAQAQGHGADRANVLRHALASAAVAPRDRADQHAVLVHQLQGGAVQLGLEDVAHLARVEGLSEPVVEAPHIAQLVGRVKRQHRGRVLDSGQLVPWSRAHAVGRRVGPRDAGMGLFKCLETTKEPVVVVVRYLGRVVHEVEPIVTVDLAGQRLHLACRLALRQLRRLHRTRIRTAGGIGHSASGCRPQFAPGRSEVAPGRSEHHRLVLDASAAWGRAARPAAGPP